MRVLITGIEGFAGSHLSDKLLEKGSYELAGAYFPGSDFSNLNKSNQDVKLYPVDLQDQSSLNKAVSDFQPQAVFHLAAASFVLSDPDLVQKVNVQGTQNLLSAIRLSAPEAKGIFISSSEVYGICSPEEGPVDESHRIAPANPYAKSKLEMENLIQKSIREENLNAVILRPFNHIGPRQSPRFVVSSFAKQIAMAETGKAEAVLSVGNLEPKRDFTDVRDMVGAYSKALTNTNSGDIFNIATGRSLSIQEMLDGLLSLSSKDFLVKKNPDLMRKSDNPDIVGNASLFKQQTGWIPNIAFEKTLLDTLNWWRSNL